MTIVGVRVSAEECLGSRTTYSEMKQLAAPCEPIAALNFLGILGALRVRQRRSLNECWWTLVDGSCSQPLRARLVDTSRRWHRLHGYKDHQTTFFDEVSLAAASHFLICEANGSAPLSQENFDALVELVWRMGDLVERDSPAELPPEGSLEALETRLYYVQTSAIRYGGDPLTSRFVRAMSIFAPHDGSHAALLRRAFLGALNVSPNQWLVGGLALLVRVLQVDSDSDVTSLELLQPFFDRSLDESGTLERNMLSRLCCSREAIRTRGCAFTNGVYRPRRFEVLASSPIVAVADRRVIASPQHLISRITESVIYDLLDWATKGNARPAELLNALGASFEAYVGAILRRVADANPGRCELIPESRLAASGGTSEKTCDFAIVVADTLFLIETKLTLFRADSRSGDDKKGFLEKLTDVFVAKAGRQLLATAGRIARGELSGLGIAPTNIRAVYPIVVTSAPVVHDHDFALWLKAKWSELPENAALEAYSNTLSVAAPEILRVGELESFEDELVANASLLPDWIARKQEVRFTGSIRDFVQRAHPSVNLTVSEWHRKAFEQSFNAGIDELDWRRLV